MTLASPRTVRYTLLTIGIAAMLGACADDDENTGTSGGGGATSGPTTGNGTAASGSGGNTVASTTGGAQTTSSGAGGGGQVQSCADLCELAPVDTPTGACVAAFINQQDYDTSLCDGLNTNTESGCLACYALISVSDDDCVAAHRACF